MIVATYALGALTAGAPSQGSVRWLAVLMMASGAGLLLANAISHYRSTGAWLRLIGAAMLAVAEKLKPFTVYPLEKNKNPYAIKRAEDARVGGGRARQRPEVQQ